MIRSSENVGAISAALCKAQSEMTPVAMNKVNPYHHSKYADLPAIWEMVRPILAKHGISLFQAPGECKTMHEATYPVDNDKSKRDSHVFAISITTRLIHTSGEWLEETAMVPMEKPTPQGLGVALTYTRRYAMAGILGIVTDEDDDGNAAERKQPARQQESSPKPAPKPAPKKKVSFDEILEKFASNTATTIEEVEHWMGKKVAEWTDSDMPSLRTFYAKQLKRHKENIGPLEDAGE